ncbi:MAG: molybdopterin biosynthesis protein MoeB [Bacteroidetes bacterium ADurb.Bin408]|nr:MAG: molybdopterin biosynthesis protein MoeB [Bacteroidetes bacterium ADurb.Bin408]
MGDTFNAHGFMSNGCLNHTPRNAYQLLINGEALLLDVRRADFSAFKCPDVKEVICMPLEELKVKYIALPKEKGLIVFDSSGINSGQVVHFLMQNGFAKVSQVAGGLVEWERDGLPMKVDTTERLSGSCMCQLRQREIKDKR